MKKMKIVLLVLSIMVLTGCANLDEIFGNNGGERTHVYNENTGKYEPNDIHTRIKNAYGVEASKGTAKWDVNYENIMY